MNHLRRREGRRGRRGSRRGVHSVCFDDEKQAMVGGLDREKANNKEVKLEKG
jgi:hypothetical protein